MQRRHNRSPAASFANCVTTLYLLKVHLQTFLSVPITQKCQILSCDTLVANERYGITYQKSLILEGDCVRLSVVIYVPICRGGGAVLLFICFTFYIIHFSFWVLVLLHFTLCCLIMFHFILLHLILCNHFYFM